MNERADVRRTKQLARFFAPHVDAVVRDVLRFAHEVTPIEANHGPFTLELPRQATPEPAANSGHDHGAVIDAIEWRQLFAPPRLLPPIGAAPFAVGAFRCQPSPS